MSALTTYDQDAAKYVLWLWLTQNGATDPSVNAPKLTAGTVLAKGTNNAFPPNVVTTATNLATSVAIDGIAISFVTATYPIEVSWEGMIQFSAAAGIAAGTSVAAVFNLVDTNTGSLLQSNSIGITRTTFVDTTTGAKHIYPFKAKTILETAPNIVTSVVGKVYLQSGAATWNAVLPFGTLGPSVIEARVA